MVQHTHGLGHAPYRGVISNRIPVELRVAVLALIVPIGIVSGAVMLWNQSSDRGWRNDALEVEYSMLCGSESLTQNQMDTKASRIAGLLQGTVPN